MFNAFWFQASLFWLLTNHDDNDLLKDLLLLLAEDLLLGLDKGLMVNAAFGSFSDMAGFTLIN